MSREQQRKTQRGETETEREPREAERRVGPSSGQGSVCEGEGELSHLQMPPPKPCLSLRKMDPPPSLMTMLSAQTLINTLS